MLLRYPRGAALRTSASTLRSPTDRVDAPAGWTDAGAGAIFPPSPGPPGFLLTAAGITNTPMAFDFTEWGITSYLRFKTRRLGELVGTDQAGNKYYVDRRTKGTKRDRRWVVFKGESEASHVPPEWHGWLHHQTDAIPTGDSPWRRPWVKEHLPNLTGTLAAYKPPGAIASGGRRRRSSGAAQTWSPDAGAGKGRV